MATSIWTRSGDTQLRQTIFEPAKGAKVSFTIGGTTTPLVVFFDADENIAAGSIVSVDGNARWPNLFVPTGAPFDYRITEEKGALIDFAENVPNPTVTDSGGSTPTTEFPTGFTAFLFQDTTLATWSRCNGRTIGSSASTATERANDDTLDLFTLLWDNMADAQAPVSGGRGGSASADFANNKTLQLPDLRGGAPIGLDTMGNIDLASLADTPFVNGDGVTPGSLAGLNSSTILTTNLPAHAHNSGALITESDGSHTHSPGTLSASSTGSNHVHSGTTANESAQHNHNYTGPPTNPGTVSAQSGTGVSASSGWANVTQTTLNNNSTHNHLFNTNSDGAHSHPITGVSAASGVHTHPITGQTENAGGDVAFSIVSRVTTGTWYIKL